MMVKTASGFTTSRKPIIRLETTDPRPSKDPDTEPTVFVVEAPAFGIGEFSLVLDNAIRTEPVTYEDALNIIEFEKPDGVLVQFGGQTPLKIAEQLTNEGVKIFGTSSASIDLAENREAFASIIKKLKIQIPEYCIAKNYEEIINFSEIAQFPVLVRPSYVLGGRAMQIVYNKEQLVDYVFRSAEATNDHPILIDQFIENAFEFDVDALSDGEEVFVAGIMQHIEEAGVHSGDSSCVLPPYDMSSKVKKDIIDMTTKLALELNVNQRIEDLS